MHDSIKTLFKLRFPDCTLYRSGESFCVLVDLTYGGVYTQYCSKKFAVKIHSQGEKFKYLYLIKNTDFYVMVNDESLLTSIYEFLTNGQD